jgi:hypothetical protein
MATDFGNWFLYLSFRFKFLSVQLIMVFLMSCGLYNLRRVLCSLCSLGGHVE